MPIHRIPILSKVMCEKLVTTPIVIVIVGLPGTAKTFLSRKLCNYLNWVQIPTKTFIVEYYRNNNLPDDLQNITDEQLFTEEFDKQTMAYLDFCYQAAINDIMTWLDNKQGHIAILDGTNSTRRRRRWIHSRFYPKYKLFFVENLSDGGDAFFEDWNPTSLSDVHPFANNVDQSDQFIAQSMKRPHNMQLMRNRIGYIKKRYETLDGMYQEEDRFIKIVDIGNKFVVNRLHGRVASHVVYYMMNLKLNAGCIYIIRHGESQFNTECRIGGNSSLSERGQQFANAVADFFYNGQSKHKISHVMTSTLTRTKQTAAPLLEKMPHLKIESIMALDEISAGKYDGLTYKEMAEQHSVELSKRDSDKFNYRYPLGESYQDLISRIESVILDLERADNVLVICHQAVARCLIGYFMGKPCDQTPYIEVALHSIIKIHSHSYQSVCERINLGVSCVDTHRPCPKNVCPNRSVEDALSTLPREFI